VTVYATVASIGPTRLAFDRDAGGITVPAKLAAAGYTPKVGDRVLVQLQTPLPPLVLGKVTS
jgi:hypothetical protein